MGSVILETPHLLMHPFTAEDLLVITLCGPGAPTAAAEAEIFHLHVPAAAELYISTCPEFDVVGLPATDATCED